LQDVDELPTFQLHRTGTGHEPGRSSWTAQHTRKATGSRYP
jgi:hypothetical protein